MDILQKFCVLGVLGIDVWEPHFILAEIDFPILGVNGILTAAASMGDMIDHII